MSEEDESGNEAAEVAEDVGEGVGKVAEVVSEAAEGDAAGAVGAGAGAVASGLGAAGAALGEDEAEAREALAAAQAVANAASSAVAAGQGIARAADTGNIGAAAGALGSATDAARYLVPDDEVRGVLEGVGTAARGIGQAVGSMSGESGGSEGGGDAARDPVRFELHVQGATERWGVVRVSLNEHLNEVPRCFLEARYEGHLEPSELLHMEATLFVERSEVRREFKGIVWHAEVDEHGHAEEVSVKLDIAPRAALLGTRQTRKLFQELTIVEVIEQVYAELLGSFEQTVNTDGLQRSYETREYIVQYDETDLAFISRLCEEEGIFWFFDHEADQPVLMLSDSTSGLEPIDSTGGELEFHEHRGDGAPDYDSVWDVHHVEEVGSSDVFLRGYDWTHPTLDVEGDATGRSETDPPREVYNPRTHALLYHSFNGTQYGGNTAAVQAGIRAERLDLDRQQWRLTTSAVGARPGHTLEVSGAPHGHFDQRYLVVAVSADGEATEDINGSWENTLEVVPVSMPYRPPRKSTRPTVNGITTAIVVGPSGEEIHTDEHGRVKVRFHWDRDHERGDEHSSLWMRVAQSWAGPGFGTFFLPRIGMEVLVSFLEGDPDRPLVTGCVYHGQNRVGVELPAKKTQSLIRTKSSPNSEGFNEMRFEDEAGNEFIYVHAEKDYNEVVENDHSTTVHNNQTNSVDVNQTETVGGDQSMTVRGNRTKTIHKDETNSVNQNRTTHVEINDTETVGGDRSLGVTGHETITVEKNRNLHVVKKTLQAHDGGREITVKSYDKLEIADGAHRHVIVSGQYNNKVTEHYVVKQADTETIYLNGHIHISSAAKIELVAPDCSIKMEDGKVAIIATNEITLQSGDSTVSLKSDGTIEAVGGTKIAVDGGGAMGEWSASGVKQTGNMVEIGADAVAKLTGTLVKIN